MTRVLHVIAALSRGGPARAVLSAAAASAAAAPELVHQVVSLAEPDRRVALRGEELGIAVVSAAQVRDGLHAAMTAADVVHVHYWNSPELCELLYEELPRARLLVWSHVSGERPPQILPSELLARADVTIASTIQTRSLPGLEALEVIPAISDLGCPKPVPRNSRRPFTVGFVGKLDFSKLHPRFVELCAALDVPDVRFVVCGAGAAMPVLRQQAARAGLGGRIEFRGFVEDVGSTLGDFDVLGYPLTPQTSAASELAVQEAMHAGVPPVVLGPAAVARNVVHDETGWVAGDERGYVEGLRVLHDEPDRRRRLGRAAAAHAAATWTPERMGPRWAQVYAALLDRPRRRRARSSAYPADGAGRFIAGLEGSAPEFAVSCGRASGDLDAADRAIAESPAVMSTGGGGILSYRDHYPDDRYLRYWCGLVLRRNGRAALAAGEFAAAARLGLDPQRVAS